MNILAITVLSLVVSYIISDIVRGRALKKTVLSLSQDFSTTLSRADELAGRLDMVRKKVENKKPARACSCETNEPLPQPSIILMQQPYLRLSIESGIRSMVAYYDSSGISRTEFGPEWPEVLVQKTFTCKLPYETASHLLGSFEKHYGSLLSGKPEPTMSDMFSRDDWFGRRAQSVNA